MIKTLKELEKLFENKRFLAIDEFMKNAQTKAQESFAVIKCEPSWKEPLMVFETAPDYVKDVDLAITVLAEIKKVVENWDEGEYYTDSIRSMKKIEDIIKGETK